MMNRLESRAPKLVAKLRLAPVRQQRAAAVTASLYAVANANVHESIVREALETLRSGAKLESDSRALLESLVEQFDDDYFDLCQEEEKDLRVSESERLLVFIKARAIASVVCAFIDDPFEAALESIYEATAVTEDPSELFASVEKVLT